MVLGYVLIILACAIIIIIIAKVSMDKTKSVPSLPSLPSLPSVNSPVNNAASSTITRSTDGSGSTRSNITTTMGENINNKISNYTGKFFITSVETKKYLSSDGLMVESIGYATPFTQNNGILSPAIGLSPSEKYVITQIGNGIIVLSSYANPSMGLVVNGVTQIISTTTDTPGGDSRIGFIPIPVIGGGSSSTETTKTSDTSIPIPALIKPFGGNKADNKFLVNLVSSV
jgi:hypothetical protein